MTHSASSADPRASAASAATLASNEGPRLNTCDALRLRAAADLRGRRFRDVGMRQPNADPGDAATPVLQPVENGAAHSTSRASSK